jgi:hypothetical protein
MVKQSAVVDVPHSSVSVPKTQNCNEAEPANEKVLIFKCGFCGKCFNTIEKTMEHQVGCLSANSCEAKLEQVRNINTNREIYKCRICEAYFTTLIDVMEHYESHN